VPRPRLAEPPFQQPPVLSFALLPANRNVKQESVNMALATLEGSEGTIKLSESLIARLKVVKNRVSFGRLDLAERDAPREGLGKCGSSGSWF
jgi:hypothetical protein